MYFIWGRAQARGAGSILMFRYHQLELLVPHAQYHLPQPKVKLTSAHSISGKLCLVKHKPVCTESVPVHTHTDHTHISFPIRQEHHCDRHEPPSDACPMLCGQQPASLQSPRLSRSGLPSEACHAQTLDIWHVSITLGSMKSCKVGLSEEQPGMYLIMHSTY